MGTNFTPLNVEKIKDDKENINTALLTVLTVVTFILAVMLFVMINKKIKEPSLSLPPIVSSPTPKATPIIPTLILSPTYQASGSSFVK